MVKKGKESKICLPFEIPREVSQRAHALIFYDAKLIPALRAEKEMSTENLTKLIGEYQEVHAEADFDLKTLREAANLQYFQIWKRRKRGRAPMNHKEIKVKLRALKLLDEAMGFERKESE